MYAASHAYAANLYQNVTVESGVESASPHRLIALLLEGAIERAGAARVALMNGDVRLARDKVGATLAILAELRNSLDHGKGGALSADLDALYEYVQQRLMAAPREQNQEAVLESMDLLSQVYAAWLDIGRVE